MGLGLSNDGLSLSLLFRMFAACKSQLSSAETQSGWTEKWCEGGSSTNRNPLPFLVYPEPHFGKYFGWLLHSVAIECCIEVYIYIQPENPTQIAAQPSIPAIPVDGEVQPGGSTKTAIIYLWNVAETIQI